MTWSRRDRPVPLRRFGDLQPAPWPTAAGVTREAVSYQESQRLTPGRPPWRLSIADLQEPGPFSRIPGVERTFVPVDGPVILRVDDRSYRIAVRTPFSFAGDVETVLTWLEAPGRAVNLMTRSGDPDAVELTVHHGAPEPDESPAVLMSLPRGPRSDAFDIYSPGVRPRGARGRWWLTIR